MPASRCGIALFAKPVASGLLSWSDHSTDARNGRGILNAFPCRDGTRNRKKSTGVAASHLALGLAALLCRQFLFDIGIYGSRKLSAVRASLTLVTLLMEYLLHIQE